MNNLLSLRLCLFLFLTAFLMKIEALSLKETYQSALSKNELVSIQEKRSLQTEERLSLAKSTFLPRLTLSGSYLKNSYQNTRPLSPSRTENMSLMLSQSLFRGFKDLAQLDIAQKSLKIVRLSNEQGKLDFFKSIAKSYYQILGLEANLSTIEEQLKLMDSQITVLTDRFNKGKSRKSDLLSFQAQRASLLAQRDSLATSIKVERSKFASLTTLSENLIFENSYPTNFNPTIHLETLLADADLRQDLVVQQLNVENAQQKITTLRSSFYPSIDLVGNYYLKNNSGTNPLEAQIGVTFTWSLFEGGGSMSAMREQTAIKQELELLLAKNKRDIRGEVRQLYESFQGGSAQRKMLEQALVLSKKAYEALLSDYEYGLTNQIEVLQAQNNYLNIKKSWNDNYYQTTLQWILLQASVGVIE